MEELVLGIDFGTSNSVVAVYRKLYVGDEDGNEDDGDVEVLPNDIEARTTPSCVHLHPTDKWLVGEAALRMATANPKNTVFNVKQVLGRSFWSTREEFTHPPLGSVDVGQDYERDACVLKMHYPEKYLPTNQRDVTPEEAAAAILQDLRETASLRLGQDVRRAVIGVPSYFNAAQRYAVKQAAELAGLQVDRLCDETSAAALAYARISPKEGVRKVVVVDVGGGGGSAAVVEVRSRSEVHVLASSGTRLPGGEDLDVDMLRFLNKKMGYKSSLNREKLQSQWKEAKKKLAFSHRSAEIKMYSTTSKEEICCEVTQQDFKDSFDLWCKGIITGINRVIQSSEISVKEVKDIVLVGASIRFPELRLKIEQIFNMKSCKVVNADEGVAIGNALLGAHQAVVNDVIPLCTTIWHYFRPIKSILANSRLPIAYMPKRFFNLSLMIKVCQGSYQVCGCSLSAKEVIEVTVDGLFCTIDESKQKKFLKPYSALSTNRYSLLNNRLLISEKYYSEERERAETKNTLEERLRSIINQLESQEGAENINLSEATLLEAKKDLASIVNGETYTKEYYMSKLKKYETVEQELERVSGKHRQQAVEMVKVEDEHKQSRKQEEQTELMRQEELIEQKPERQKEPFSSGILALKHGTDIPSRTLNENQAQYHSKPCQIKTISPDCNYHLRQSDKSGHTSSMNNITEPPVFVSTYLFSPALTKPHSLSQVSDHHGRDKIKKAEAVLLQIIKQHTDTTEAFSKTPMLWTPSNNTMSHWEEMLMKNQELVLQTISYDVSVQVISNAFSTECAVLLTGMVYGSGDTDFIFLAVRYISNQEPVECLLALLDSSVTDQDLFEYFTKLCDEASVSWQRALIGISVDRTLACYEFYKLLKRVQPSLKRVWNSSQRLDDYIAQECYRYIWGKNFFSVVDTVKKFFLREKWLNVLKKHCSSVLESNLASYEQVIHFLVKYSFRQAVLNALNEIQSIEPKIFFEVNLLMSRLADDDFIIQVVTVHKVLSVVKGTSEILTFSSDCYINDFEIIQSYEYLRGPFIFENILNIAAQAIQKNLTAENTARVTEILSSCNCVLERCLKLWKSHLHDYHTLKSGICCCRPSEKNVWCLRLENASVPRKPPNVWLKLISETDPNVANECVRHLLTLPLLQIQKNKTVLELQNFLYKSLPYSRTYFSAILILKSTPTEVTHITNLSKILQCIEKHASG